MFSLEAWAGTGVETGEGARTAIGAGGAFVVIRNFEGIDGVLGRARRVGKEYGIGVGLREVSTLGAFQGFP